MGRGYRKPCRKFVRLIRRPGVCQGEEEGPSPKAINEGTPKPGRKARQARNARNFLHAKVQEVRRPPITKERVERPTAEGFNDIGRNS